MTGDKKRKILWLHSFGIGLVIGCCSWAAVNYYTGQPLPAERFQLALLSITTFNSLAALVLAVRR